MRTVIFVSLFFLLISKIQSQSRVGINTNSPQGTLHIVKGVDEHDPIIVSDVQDTSDPPNPAEGDNISYYRLKISENGVVRRESDDPNDIRQVFSLDGSLPILPGNAQGSGGSVFMWKDINGTPIGQYVTLPEDGAYIFSFRLYGTVTRTSSATSFYLSGWKESSLVDIIELFIQSAPTAVNNTNNATYSAQLTIWGKARDRIYFKLSHITSYQNIGLTLLDRGLGTGYATSLLFWKI